MPLNTAEWNSPACSRLAIRSAVLRDSATIQNIWYAAKSLHIGTCTKYLFWLIRFLLLIIVHLVRDQEVAGSNPVSPTRSRKDSLRLFHFRRTPVLRSVP